MRERLPTDVYSIQCQKHSDAPQTDQGPFFGIRDGSSAAVRRGHDVKFNRDVRPILSDKCFGCHGSDAATKKIPLRLDSKTASRAVVQGGAQAETRSTHHKQQDREMRMPQAYSGLTLDAGGDRDSQEMGRTGRPVGEALVRSQNLRNGLRFLR